jgi:hypothetical protein
VRRTDAPTSRLPADAHGAAYPVVCLGSCRPAPTRAHAPVSLGATRLRGGIACAPTSPTRAAASINVRRAINADLQSP